MAGYFITFEGSEGCGKSTQIARLKTRLEAKGRRVVSVREPGGTALGEKVRSLLQFDAAGQGMAPEAELMLFAASRAQLVREIIGPALREGAVVIADRFLDSTVVYQGMARKLGREVAEAVNALAVGDCLPDRTFLLDMEAAVATERARKVSEAAGVSDRMERENDEFFALVRRGFLDLAEEAPERFRVIDASQSVDEVSQAIWAILQEDGIHT
ncbi:MAG: dTMP kinase [Verrucomicrobiota bacterium]